MNHVIPQNISPNAGNSSIGSILLPAGDAADAGREISSAGVSPPLPSLFGARNIARHSGHCTCAPSRSNGTRNKWLHAGHEITSVSGSDDMNVVPRRTNIEDRIRSDAESQRR